MCFQKACPAKWGVGQRSMESLTELAAQILRYAPSDGLHPCALPRVTLIRSSGPTMPMPVIYQPSICVVAQGRKQVVLGDLMHVYDRATFVLASVDLPVIGSVIEATTQAPYLSLQYDLDIAMLGQLVLDRDPARDTPPPRAGLALHEMTPELADACRRLTALLDAPDDIPVLAPLIEREILYRLINGPGAPMMRYIAMRDGSLARISRVIAWIKGHYAEPLVIEELADLAGMSPSSLHAHFKAVTRMSPLQYRAQLRLQEARRLMVAEGTEAAQAGFRVGYNSPSQFSREYARLYGAAPAADAAQVRASARN
jgi:AraC-like DNA-binding protein